jgi:hypothetical protein
MEYLNGYCDEFVKPPLEHLSELCSECRKRLAPQFFKASYQTKADHVSAGLMLKEFRFLIKMGCWNHHQYDNMFQASLCATGHENL